MRAVLTDASGKRHEAHVEQLHGHGAADLVVLVDLDPAHPGLGAEPVPVRGVPRDDAGSPGTWRPSR